MVVHFTLRTHYVNKVFFRKKIGFDDSFDVTKCLQQIEMPDLLHVCAIVKWATIYYKNHDHIFQGEGEGGEGAGGAGQPQAGATQGISNPADEIKINTFWLLYIHTTEIHFFLFFIISKILTSSFVIYLF